VNINIPIDKPITGVQLSIQDANGIKNHKKVAHLA